MICLLIYTFDMIDMLCSLFSIELFVMSLLMVCVCACVLLVGCLVNCWYGSACVLFVIDSSCLIVRLSLLVVYKYYRCCIVVLSVFVLVLCCCCLFGLTCGFAIYIFDVSICETC